MISVVIQGGAMRSIYCLGAIRALAESPYLDKVRTMHASSAGCVSAAVLAAKLTNVDSPSVAEMVDQFVDRLAGPRFIDQRRFRKIVDVDYLVRVVRDVTGVSRSAVAERGLVFEVAVTDARNGSAGYLDIARLSSDVDVYEALRATMAIPVLYPCRVRIQGREYVDGGICDPLSVLRGLQQKPEVLVAVSSVPQGDLGEAAEGREARIIRYAPGISPAVRRLMLTRNPLADAVDHLLTFGMIGGTQIIRIAPERSDPPGHRLETDAARLRDLEARGYRDGLQALAALENQGVASAGGG